MDKTPWRESYTGPLPLVGTEGTISLPDGWATGDLWRAAECPTKIPEPHLLGEFPMTCYACHMEADS